MGLSINQGRAENLQYLQSLPESPYQRNWMCKKVATVKIENALTPEALAILRETEFGRCSGKGLHEALLHTGKGAAGYYGWVTGFAQTFLTPAIVTGLAFGYHKLQTSEYNQDGNGTLPSLSDVGEKIWELGGILGEKAWRIPLVQEYWHYIAGTAAGTALLSTLVFLPTDLPNAIKAYIVFRTVENRAAAIKRWDDRIEAFHQDVAHLRDACVNEEAMFWQIQANLLKDELATAKQNPEALKELQTQAMVYRNAVKVLNAAYQTKPFNAEQVRRITSAIREASGVVLGTPVSHSKAAHDRAPYAGG